MLKRALKDLVREYAPSIWLQRRESKRPKSAELELTHLPGLVRAGGVAVDIGANMGLYARALAEIADVVHAFEPIPEMTRLLRRTTPVNVKVHGLGLSDSVGEADLHIPRSRDGLTFGIASLHHMTGDNDVRRIRLSTLDDEISGPVDFVKIDVEGHELSTLSGSVRTIERCQPVFLVEAEDRHRENATGDIFRFFADRGYSGHFLMNGRFRPATEFTLDLQDTAALDSDGGRRPGRHYINNFVFVPRGSAAAAYVQGMA